MTIDVLRVINLARAPERMRRFAARHPELAFQRFEARDGARLDRDALVREGVLSAESRYTTGAIGCAVSHLTLWQACRAAGAPFHVAEDDVALAENFCVLAGELLAELQDWDFVLWGGNGDWPMAFLSEYGENPAYLIPDVRADVRTDIRPRVRRPRLFRLRFAMGTSCYSISPRGAAYLLDACRAMGRELPVICEPLANDVVLPTSAAAGRAAFLEPFVGKRQFNNGVDAELCRHYPNMNAYVCLPALTRHSFDPSESSVQT